MTITREIMKSDAPTAEKQQKLRDALERTKSIMKDKGVKPSKQSQYYKNIFGKCEAIGCLPDDYYLGQNQRLKLYRSDSYYYNSNLAEINGAIAHLANQSA